MERRRVQILREPRQMAAMASPIRVRILAVVGSAEPLSVAELAAQVGVAPASLYYHVQKLVAAGLLRERGRRRSGKRWEVLYGSTGGEVVADTHRRTPAFLGALDRIYRAVLRDTARGLTRALEHEQRAGRGPRATTAVRHRRVRLRRADLAEVHRRLEELDAFLGSADHPEGTAFDVTTVFSLCVPRRPR
jgi:DNA-binding transcriptional ArsR family regulator